MISPEELVHESGEAGLQFAIKRDKWYHEHAKFFDRSAEAFMLGAYRSFFYGLKPESAWKMRYLDETFGSSGLAYDAGFLLGRVAQAATIVSGISKLLG